MSGAQAPDTARRTDRPNKSFEKGGGNAALLFLRQSMIEQLPPTSSSMPTPLPVVRGLLGQCPACGKGKMFDGFLTVRPVCSVCGLDYSFADAGDGPAVFVSLIGGAIVVFAALMTEIVYQPPYWLHAVLWLPLILIVTLLPLRMVKGLLITLQYHHKAAPGRLVSTGDAPKGDA
jgi:uncharacterized protein (DUF983 family)